MTYPNDATGAELYLGRDWQTARLLGPRRFRSVSNALRFAFEQAAPVSLRGARLTVADRSFTGADLARLNQLRLERTSP